uniref:Transcription initiation factor TFIID subunit 8 n=1 Tax=Panagrolaimus sp. ES5 TaxID=591445 RepID=A0AC34GW97_9BILA
MVGISYDNVIFKTVKNAIIVQANAAGFVKAEGGVIDEITNIVCSYMMSISVGCKQYSELAGRSTSNSFDLITALGDNGCEITKLKEYMLKHPSVKPIKIPSVIPLPSEPVIKVGEERSQPSHIPSFLPRFPNPHTYVNTEITSDFETSYAKARELQAQNKRNAENSLFRYALSTHENYCLFRSLHETVKEKAKSDLEKQEAEIQAKRARYSDNVSDMFELKETTNSIVRKTIPDFYFVLKPFPVTNPTMLALCDDQDDELPSTVEEQMDESKLTDGGVDISLDDILSPDSLMSDDN